MTDQEYNKVKEYALEKYPRIFKDAKQIFVMENDSVYFVTTKHDQSPLILNKNIIREFTEQDESSR